MTLSRRHLLRSLGLGSLGAVGALATGCPRKPAAISDAGSAAPAPFAPTVSIPDEDGPPPLVCEPTADNIEGPFWKPGSPFRAQLSDAKTRGITMAIGGQVMGGDCRPLAGATLDVWHADGAGEYDHTGWRLRGRLTTDASGRWHVDSVVPGNYLNGARYRPRHVHVKLAAPGHRELTTQLYFPGDPYNDGDPWFVPSLMLAQAGPSRDMPGFWGRFDFVLEAA
jgi:protocatechuate 3,4-dioxygenase beta subunit